MAKGPEGGLVFWRLMFGSPFETRHDVAARMDLSKNQGANDVRYYEHRRIRLHSCWRAAFSDKTPTLQARKP
jgi:hypothetical protein